MSSSLPTPTIHMCRDCGSGAAPDAHFCPQCTKILPLGRQADYFAFLGVPRKLEIDAEDLERRFRALSRQFHPDYFYNATPAERRASLERSSYLNDAYRALKQPITRIAYLLELEGIFKQSDRGESGGSTHVPADLLEEVFTLNEELADIREARDAGEAKSSWGPRLEEAARPIDAKRREHEQQLEQLSYEWDALVDRNASEADRRKVLEALRDRMLERNYINNLLDTIEREKAGAES